MIPSHHTIQVYSGARVDPLHLRPEDITLRDIARSLSQQCRFTGHTLEFYSVAEHSCRVAQHLVHESLSCRRWGLCHDASEAYLRDVPSPLKSLPEFAAYRAAEYRAQIAVAKRFGLRNVIPAAVLHADKVLLATEARDLMATPQVPWIKMPRPLKDKIKTLKPWAAEQWFLDMAEKLGLA